MPSPDRSAISHKDAVVDTDDPAESVSAGQPDDAPFDGLVKDWYSELWAEDYEGDDARTGEVHCGDSGNGIRTLLIPLSSLPDGLPETSRRDPSAVTLHILRHYELPHGIDLRLEEENCVVDLEHHLFEAFRKAHETYTLAYEHLREGRLDEAIPLLQKILSINPYLQDARTQMVQIIAKTEGPSVAMDELLDGLRLDPENDYYHVTAAYLLCEEPENHETAIRFLDSGLRLGADYPLAIFMQGMLAFKEGKHEEALAHFGRIREDDSLRMYRHFGLARVFSELGRHRETMREIEILIAHGYDFVPDERFRGLMQYLYLKTCEELLDDVEPLMRVARRELDALEVELGWSVATMELAEEVFEDPYSLESPLPSLRWISEDRPGEVLLAGTSAELSDPQFLLLHAQEIRMETPIRKKRGIRHLRDMCLKASDGMEMTNGAAVPFDGDERERAAFIAQARHFLACELFKPLAWLARTRILERWPEESSAEIIASCCSCHARMAEDGCLDEFLATLSPEVGYAIRALCGADALFLRHITRGVMDATPAYRANAAWLCSLAVFDHWKILVEAKALPDLEERLLRETAILVGITPGTLPPVQGRLL